MSFVIFKKDRVVFKNPSTPWIKISRLYLRKKFASISMGKNTGCKDGKITLDYLTSVSCCSFGVLCVFLTDYDRFR